MSDKYIVSDLVKFLNYIGEMDYFNNDEDREKFTEIKDKLIESIKTKKVLVDMDWDIKKVFDLWNDMYKVISSIKTTLNSVENIFKRGV